MGIPSAHRALAKGGLTTKHTPSQSFSGEFDRDGRSPFFRRHMVRRRTEHIIRTRYASPRKPVGATPCGCPRGGTNATNQARIVPTGRGGSPWPPFSVKRISRSRRTRLDQGYSPWFQPWALGLQRRLSLQRHWIDGYRLRRAPSAYRLLLSRRSLPPRGDDRACQRTGLPARSPSPITTASTAPWNSPKPPTPPASSPSPAPK